MAVFKKKDTNQAKHSEKSVKNPRQKKENQAYDDRYNLSPQPGSIKDRKRVGRGEGSGLGKTCGRGQKGQGSRSGGGVKIGFEGGQMPLQRRLPKRGFVNIHRKQYNLIRLNQVAQIKELPEKIDKQFLIESGLLKDPNNGIKIIGTADLPKPVNFEVEKATGGAQNSIEKAGGQVTIIEKPTKLIKNAKKEKENKKPRKEKKMQKAMQRIAQQ